MKKIISIIIFIFVTFPMFCYANDNHIVISEIKISGNTSTDEYIKLYNPLDSDRSLVGYKLIKKTTSGSSYNLVSNFLEGTIIKANSYFVISHKDFAYGDYYYTSSSYSVSKDNSIYLIDKDLQVVDLIGFGNCFEKEGNFCLENIDDGFIYKRINDIDSDNNKNDFEIKNENIGYGYGEEETLVAIENVNVNNLIQNSVVETKIVYSKNIIISEIYPNPKNNDDEFIEIKNIGNFDIDLTNYGIKDNSKRIFKIKNVVLKPGEYYVFYKERTGIALNNSGEEAVYLLTPDNEVFFTLKYFDTKVENSYALDNDGQFYWSKVITPGYSNIIKKENTLPVLDCKIQENIFMRIAFSIDCSDSYDEDGDTLKFDFNMGDGREIKDQNNFYFSYFASGKYIINLKIDDQNGGVVFKDYKINVRGDLENSGFLVDEYNNKVNDVVNSVMQRDMECQTIDVDEIQNIDNDQCVTINSSVILGKGIFNDDYFYVNGAQIYYTKSDLTNIKEGNMFKIRGYIGSNYGEKRIKLRNKEDIELIVKNKPVEPILINDIDDLDYNIAKLVYVEGVLKNKTKSNLLIDNNGKEFYVYIKDNLKINLDKVKEGSYVHVSGIVNKRNDKLKIFLRKSEDVKVIKKDNNITMAIIKDDENATNTNNQKDIEYNLNNNSNQNNKFTILIIGIIVFVLTVILGFIVLYDRKGNRQKIVSYYRG